MRPYLVLASISLMALASAACSGSSSSPTPAPATTPVAATACPSDASRCIQGTITAPDFTIGMAQVHVSVYDTFPYGSAKPLVQVLAQNGAFAVDGLPAGGRVYLQATAKFSGDAGDAGVASVTGPFTLPLTASVALIVRPVFLEALQQRPPGGQLAFAWASAHVYEPASGKELTDATVEVDFDGHAASLPFGTNLSGQTSYFAQVDGSTPYASTVVFNVRHPSFGAAVKSYTLRPDTLDFDTVIQSPADQASITVGQPLSVAWQPEPRAAYALVELFFSADGVGHFAPKYTSDAPRGTAVTSETVPASAIDAPGRYLLNVQQARPSCLPGSDGCVYNASTAAANLTAK